MKKSLSFLHKYDVFFQSIEARESCQSRNVRRAQEFFGILFF